MVNASGIRPKIDNADLAIAQRLDPLMRLTPPQRRFCEAYMRTGNATQSAKHAGYAPSSAPQSGKRLLEREDVQQALQELWIAETIANGVTPERVAAEVATIAFNRGEDTQDRDRLKALELLSRYLGMFDDKLRISLDDPDVIEAATRYGIEPNELVQEMAQLAPIDTEQS